MPFGSALGKGRDLWRFLLLDLEPVLHREQEQENQHGGERNPPKA